MVSYQKFTSLAFEVAKSEGAQFDGIEDGADVIEVASSIWSDRREELRTATVAEARRVLEEEIVIS